MRGYPPVDIGRHIDIVKGNYYPAECSHCGAAIEEGEYCETCAPFYREGQSEYKAMYRFWRKWHAEVFARMGFRLHLVDNDASLDYRTALWLCLAEGGVIERWDHEPSIGEIVWAAYGPCTCTPASDCQSCEVLNGVLNDGELPY